MWTATKLRDRAEAVGAPFLVEQLSPGGAEPMPDLSTTDRLHVDYEELDQLIREFDLPPTAVPSPQPNATATPLPEPEPRSRVWLAVARRW